MTTVVTRYTFPNGAAVHSHRYSDGSKFARGKYPATPDNLTFPLSRQNAAQKLRNARAAGVAISRARWIAG